MPSGTTAILMSMAIGIGLPTAAATAAPPVNADMVLYNGKVLTMAKTPREASVIVISDGRIKAVGGAALLRHWHGGTAIDLHGRVALPGFMDTHLHPTALSPRAVDLAGATSIGDVQKLVAAKASTLGPGEWVTGYGWAEDRLAEKRNLTRADLDVAAPANPVALTRAGGHSVVGNSAALKLAGIDRATPQPERGLIEHDASGEPNGIIRERTNILVSLVPPDKPGDVRASYVEGLKGLTRLGITSIIIASASIGDEVAEVLRPEMPKTGLTFRELQAIYALHGSDLPRAAAEISYPGAAALKAYPHKTGYGDTRLRLGAIGEAPAVDGGFTGPTAWTTQPYKDQAEFHGQPFFKDDEDLRTVARDVAANGWQLGLHTIGDAAIDQAARVYGSVIRERSLKDHRWYLAHFTMLPSDATMATIRETGIWAAAQPNFLYNLEVRYLQTLQGEALEHNNPIAIPAARGVPFAFGSDNLPIDPRVGLYAAVTRKGPSGRVYGKAEAIPIAEALRYYTAAGPYLTWEEHEKGTLEPGKLADLIVLDRDPTTVAPDQLLTMNVDMTIIGGKPVYRRAGAE